MLLAIVCASQRIDDAFVNAHNTLIQSQDFSGQLYQALGIGHGSRDHAIVNFDSFKQRWISHVGT